MNMAAEVQIAGEHTWDAEFRGPLNSDTGILTAVCAVEAVESVTRVRRPGSFSVEPASVPRIGKDQCAVTLRCGDAVGAKRMVGSKNAVVGSVDEWLVPLVAPCRQQLVIAVRAR